MHKCFNRQLGAVKRSSHACKWFPTELIITDMSVGNWKSAKPCSEYGKQFSTNCTNLFSELSKSIILDLCVSWMLFMLSVFALRFLSVSLLNLDYDLDSVLCCLPRNFVLVCKYLFWRLLSSKNVQILFDWRISYKLIVSCFVKHCFPRLNHFALFLASFI